MERGACDVLRRVVGVHRKQVETGELEDKLWHWLIGFDPDVNDEGGAE